MAKEAFINLGVAYLSKRKNWDVIKDYSKRGTVIFSDSENQDAKPKHFGFGFSTPNVSDLLKFYVILIDDKGEQIEFEKNLHKVAVINFGIQVIR